MYSSAYTYIYETMRKILPLITNFEFRVALIAFVRNNRWYNPLPLGYIRVLVEYNLKFMTQMPQG